jgi:hypothetical protein
MIRCMILGIVAAVSLLSVTVGRNAAFACMKTNGCNHEVANEDHEMKRDGRMDKAIQAGRDNVEAFKAFQAAERARGGASPSSAR